MIKSFKQFFESSNLPFEVVSEVFYDDERGKYTVKEIGDHDIDKYLRILNSCFKSYNIKFEREDEISINMDNGNMGDVSYYKFIDGDNSIIEFFRTDDDMILFNYYLTTYNMGYDKYYRIDMYNDDSEFENMFDDMLEYFYDNFVLGVDSPIDL